MTSSSTTRALSAAELAATTAPTTPKPEPVLIAPAGVETERRVDIAFPVRVGDDVIDHVIVRRLRGRDFARLRSHVDEDGLAVLAVMTDLTREVLGALDANDFINLQEAAANFLPEKLTAGPPTS